MIDEASEDAVRRGFKKVGVVCSQSTRDLRLYSESLINRGIEPIVATDEEQKMINRAIKDVMAGEQGSHNIYDLNKVFENFVNKGAEAVILGCTEIPLAVTQNDTEILLLDANEVVVREAVRMSMS